MAKKQYLDLAGLTTYNDEIQSQLDGLSSDLDDHTHSGSDITSGTVAAARLPNASASAAGIVSTGSQTLAGAKTFSGKITASSGITTGGDIVSDTANTDDVGSISIPFANMYTKNLCINPKTVSGSVKFYGSFAATTEGTTTTDGYTELKVGNNTPTGSEGNARGLVQIYNSSSGSVTLEAGHSNSTDYRVYLPSAGGTLALNSIFGKSGSTAKSGLVPAPSTTAGTTKYLREDGTWQVPPDNNTDTKVTQAAAITTDGNYPVILGNSTATTSVTGTVNKSAGLAFNPKTGTLYINDSDDTGKLIIGDWLELSDSGNYSHIIGGIDETTLKIGSGKLLVDDVEVSVAGHTHSEYAASSHNHAASEITSGTLDAARLPAATSSALGGVKVGSNISNSSGTISLTKDNVTAALGYTPPTSDTKYTHPTTSGNKHIPSGGSSGQFLKWSADGTAVWAADNNTTYSVVSTTADGLAPKRDGSTTKFLRADGTWAVPPDNNTTYTSLKNPYSLTIQGDGKTLANGIYDGSAAKTVNITPSAIGAATAAQGTRADNAMPKSGGTFTGAVSGTNISLSGFLNAGGKTSKTDGKTGIIVGATGNMFLQGGAPTVSFYMGSDTSSVGNVLGAKSASNSGLHFTVNNGAGVALWNSTSDIPCYFRPLTNAKAGLGSESYRWYRLWASNSCNTSSDEREKSDIMSIADYPTTWSRDGSGNVFEKLFNKLVPKTYTLNVEPTDEIHMGFIAQDVATAFEELGLSEDDLGFISHDYWTDEETGEEKDRYGLAYEEFIALNTYMIQKQRDKIESLEERIAQLEELVNSN